MPAPFRLQMPEPREYATHVSVADVVRKWGHPHCYWLHIPNAQLGGAARGAILKQMGRRAGAPDFFFMIGGAVLFLELKRHGEKLSEAQAANAELATLAGADYRVAFSLEEAIGILRGFGVLTRDLLFQEGASR